MAEQSPDFNPSLPTADEMTLKLSRPPIPPLPEDFPHGQRVYDSRLRLGTLEQAIGSEAAEKFFSEPDPFEDSRTASRLMHGQ